MTKFPWPTFYAVVAAIIVTSVVSTWLFKKKVEPTTGDVKLQFKGASGLTGYN